MFLFLFSPHEMCGLFRSNYDKSISSVTNFHIRLESRKVSKARTARLIIFVQEGCSTIAFDSTSVGLQRAGHPTQTFEQYHCLFPIPRAVLSSSPVKESLQPLIWLTRWSFRLIYNLCYISVHRQSLYGSHFLYSKPTVMRRKKKSQRGLSARCTGLRINWTLRNNSSLFKTSSPEIPAYLCYSCPVFSEYFKLTRIEYTQEYKVLS